MFLQALTIGPSGPALPDSMQILSIAAISFVIGVLVCLLCGLYLLPALVRAQSSELIRDYAMYVQPPAPMRVIVLQRDSEDTRSRPSPPSPSGRRTVRVDQPTAAPDRLPSSPTNGQRDEKQDVFHHIYEHNLQLRQQQADRPRSEAAI